MKVAYDPNRPGAANLPSQTSKRLRVPDTQKSPIHVVLVEPEIPQNTGNIARLCAATRSPLHLIGPLGFQIDESAVKRAGLDYWPLVELHRHLDLKTFEHRHPNSRLLFLSARATRSYSSIEFQEGDALVFGRESVGLPAELLIDREEDVIGIPTFGGVRSLNLSNSVSIVLYEALRQLGLLHDAMPR